MGAIATAKNIINKKQPEKENRDGKQTHIPDSDQQSLLYTDNDLATLCYI